MKEDLIRIIGFLEYVNTDTAIAVYVISDDENIVKWLPYIPYYNSYEFCLELDDIGVKNLKELYWLYKYNEIEIERKIKEHILINL